MLNNSVVDDMPVDISAADSKNISLIMINQTSSLTSLLL
jgi:hypothetical protein